MLDFDLEIKYRKGSLNSVADALSRVGEVNSLSFIELQDDLYDFLRGLCQNDNHFSKYWHEVQTGSSTVTDQDSRIMSTVSVAGGQFWIRNGLLFRNNKVYVPDVQELKEKILHECHDVPSVTGGGYVLLELH